MYDKVRKERAGRLFKEWQKGDYVKNGKIMDSLKTAF